MVFEVAWNDNYKDGLRQQKMEHEGRVLSMIVYFDFILRYNSVFSRFNTEFA